MSPFPNGINPNQLFHWRKLYQDGSLSAVSAGEAVVATSSPSPVPIPTSLPAPSAQVTKLIYTPAET